MARTLILLGGPGASGTPGGVPAAPGNCTIQSVTVDPKPRDLSATGGRGIVRGIGVKLAIPSPVATFLGVNIQVDVQHAVTRMVDAGKVYSAGITASGAGPSQPVTFPTFSYASYGDGAGAMVVHVEIQEPRSFPITARVTVISYSSQVVNDPNSSPYQDVTINAPAVDKPNAGTAYCLNPLTVSAGTPTILKPSGRS